MSRKHRRKALPTLTTHIAACARISNCVCPIFSGKTLRQGEPVYQAIWVENDSFDEVLISPVMIQDHMPDKVLQALQKVGPHWGLAGQHGRVLSLCRLM